jgi:hypothetical protein
VWNLVSSIKGRELLDIREQVAGENVWAEGGGYDRRLEKYAERRESLI